MNIGIIGFGVVGKAVAKTFSRQNKIIKYDKFSSYDKFSDLEKCDFIFITVPTPFDCEDNKTDTSAVFNSLERLEKLNFRNIVVIKSTLPPGTCDKYIPKFNYRIIYNPEFLRESIDPNKDFAEQDTIVIGAENKKDFENTKRLYQEIAVPNAEYYYTTHKEAEMIKCAQNTMLASRVALANMIFDACEKNNINYEIVREIAFDRFQILGPHMVQVPGPDGKRGFGGKCLPKDIRLFSSIYQSRLLNEIISYNDTLRDDLENFLVNFKKGMK